MAQNTNLNVTPYYDDFDKTKNFYRVLFRPGFPIHPSKRTYYHAVYTAESGRECWITSIQRWINGYSWSSRL